MFLFLFLFLFCESVKLNHFDLSPPCSVKYNLIANICHESPAEVGREGKRDVMGEGSYHVHVKHNASSTWFKIQDLESTEFMAELIGLSESYILIFGRK